MKGVVTDADGGKPLAGVSVSIDGTNLGTLTDDNGHYILRLPAGRNELTFSFIGYHPAKAKATDNVVNVALTSSNTELNEVIVVAYGSATKATYTGSVATVSENEIKKTPVSSISRILQGNVPRLTTDVTNWNSTSTRFLFDATYARLKNLNLSYTFPNSFQQKLQLQNAQVFVRGENLLTLYGHHGMDPEQAIDGVTFYRYPAQKTITLGLSVSL